LIRLKIVSGSRSGTTLAFGREPIRVGRNANAEVRFHDTQDTVVSGHHAQIVFERGAYQLLDLGSRNGTWLNGRRLTTKQALRSGDRIVFGHPGGPESEVHIDSAASAPSAGDSAEHTVELTLHPHPAAYDAALDAERMANGLKQAIEDTGNSQVSEELARQVAERRAQAGGQRSGDTVVLLAQAINQATAGVKSRRSC
jgi:predicted component of type VI protein secretion system